MNTLGVFAKWPEPGRVKTRLGLVPEDSARIAEAFLLDTLDRCQSLLAIRRMIVFTPEIARSRFQAVAPPGWECEAQDDGDLGQRLSAFFQRHLPHGPVVAVGTDSPTLPVETIQHAFALLTDADLVLGPACDGGYYLVGLREVLPPLFTGIDWSSSRVLEQTVAALSDPVWRLRLLPPWYDVDTPSDWQLLRGHLAALRRAGLDPGVPRTEALRASKPPGGNSPG